MQPKQTSLAQNDAQWLLLIGSFNLTNLAVPQHGKQPGLQLLKTSWKLMHWLTSTVSIRVSIPTGNCAPSSPQPESWQGWGLRVALALTAHACLQWRHAPIKYLLEASRKLPSALIPCLAEVCWALWRLVKSDVSHQMLSTYAGGFCTKFKKVLSTA